MIMEIDEGTKPNFWLYLHIDEGGVLNVRMAFLLCRTLEGNYIS